MSAHPVTDFSDTGNTYGTLNDPMIIEKNFSEEFLSVLRMKSVRELYEAYPRAKAEEKLLFKQVLLELRAPQRCPSGLSVPWLLAQPSFIFVLAITS